MSIRGIYTLLEKLITDLNNRETVSDKLNIAIRSHAHGFELAPTCIEEGHFIIRVYPYIPLEGNVETDGEAVFVIKFSPSDTIRARTFNDCWIEFIDISEAQFETYLEFGALAEVDQFIEYEFNEEDKFTLWKFSPFD